MSPVLLSSSSMTARTCYRWSLLSPTGLGWLSVLAFHLYCKTSGHVWSFRKNYYRKLLNILWSSSRYRLDFTTEAVSLAEWESVGVSRLDVVVTICDMMDPTQPPAKTATHRPPQQPLWWQHQIYVTCQHRDGGILSSGSQIISRSWPRLGWWGLVEAMVEWLVAGSSSWCL